MKYLRLIWSFICNYVYAFTIGLAIITAAFAPMGARLEVQQIAFNSYLCFALLLAGILGFKSKDWFSAKKKYGKLFLALTGLNMVVAKMYLASPNQTMYMILMMHLYVGTVFFMSYAIATTPNPLKAGNVVVTRWSMVVGSVYMLVGGYIFLTLPKFSPQIAEFILLSIR